MMQISPKMIAIILLDVKPKIPATPDATELTAPVTALPIPAVETDVGSVEIVDAPLLPVPNKVVIGLSGVIGLSNVNGLGEVIYSMEFC